VLSLAGFIPENTITDIKNAVDILDIVSEAVLLKKNGNNYIGLCPFHAEKTPSFTVSQQKQIFHCFGCGEGGNVFNFLMKHDGLTFPETVSRLAKRCGIDIPRHELTIEQKRQLDEKQHILNLNLKVAHLYQKTLKDTRISQKATAYLNQRGFTTDTIQAFRLGYAPQRWDYLIQHLTKENVPLQLAEKAGLIVARKQSNGYYDRFRGRIVFPIIDMTKQVLGFGGRVLGEDVPKYLNTPETPVYHKKNTLYGLHRAKSECRNKAEVIIVEGYLDLLALHQHGILNASATLGTALTPEHVKLLKGFIGGEGRVILVFDSDEAGIKAAQRSIPTFEKNFANVKISVLPPGYDPDSFLMEYGPEAFISETSQAKGAMTFLTDRAIHKHGLSIEGKIKILSDLIEPLSSIKDTVRRGLYIRELSEKIGVDEAAIIENIRERTKKNTGILYREKSGLSQGKPNGRFHPKESRMRDVIFAKADRLERQIIAMMIQYPKILPEIDDRRILQSFSNKDLQNIGYGILKRSHGQLCDVAELINFADDDGQRQLITSLSLINERWSKEGCLGLLHQYERSRNQLKQHLIEEIKAAEKNNDDALLTKLLEKMQQIATNRL
jgi:DNA primase